MKRGIKKLYKKIIIVTIKTWNINNAKLFAKKYYDELEIVLIENPDELNINFVNNFNPDYIFFPHWSWIIPKEIFEKFNCIVFHMTDLPFGRGGSPLQNLIERGIKETKISAIEVTEVLDGGNIYLKRDLNLNGTADEIFVRASNIIFFDMIPNIVKSEIIPVAQVGDIISFKRRSPSDSNINISIENIEALYNHIRMLDGEGYPKAFLEYGKFKLELSRASFKGNSIIADVKIIEVENE